MAPRSLVPFKHAPAPRTTNGLLRSNWASWSRAKSTDGKGSDWLSPFPTASEKKDNKSWGLAAAAVSFASAASLSAASFLPAPPAAWFCCCCSCVTRRRSWVATI